MQEKKRIPLKRLHRLRNARKQAAETDDLTPMMKAIKAVHSVTSTGSTQPEDLERQRAAQELFARLVTPNLLINTTPITVNNVSAEWVRMNQGHDRRHVVLYCHGGGYTCEGVVRVRHMISTHLDGCGPTQHLLGNLEVDAGDPQRPLSRIQVRAAHQGLGERSHLCYDAIGFYEDEWVRLPEGWRIQKRSMTVLLEIGERSVLQPGT